LTMRSRLGVAGPPRLAAPGVCPARGWTAVASGLVPAARGNGAAATARSASAHIAGWCARRRSATAGPGAGQGRPAPALLVAHRCADIRERRQARPGLREHGADPAARSSSRSFPASACLLRWPRGHLLMAPARGGARLCRGGKGIVPAISHGLWRNRVGKADNPSRRCRIGQGGGSASPAMCEGRFQEVACTPLPRAIPVPPVTWRSLILASAVGCDGDLRGLPGNRVRVRPPRPRICGLRGTPRRPG